MKNVVIGLLVTVIASGGVFGAVVSWGWCWDWYIATSVVLGLYALLRTVAGLQQYYWEHVRDDRGIPRLWITGARLWQRECSAEEYLDCIARRGNSVETVLGETICRENEACEKGNLRRHSRWMVGGTVASPGFIKMLANGMLLVYGVTLFWFNESIWSVLLRIGSQG